MTRSSFNLIEQALLTVERTLRFDLLPELQSPAARLQADLMSRLLQWLATREAQRGEQDGIRDLALSNVAADARVALSDRTQKGDTGDDLAVLRELVASLRGADPACDRDVLALVGRYVELEERYIRAMDPEGGGSLDSVFNGGRMAGSADRTALTPVTNDTLTAYLRHRFPEYPLICALEVRALEGGFGKETFIYRMEGYVPCPGVTVIRKDMRVPPTGMRVQDEFPLLQALAARGLALPRPLWCEPDTQWFGAAFIVVQGVVGTGGTRGWSESPDVVRQIADDMAKFLATIHAIRPGDSGFLNARPSSAAAATIDHMNSLYQLYKTRTIEVNPRIEVAYSWLLSHLPSDAHRPASLVHGDFGFHNMLIDQGHIRAVLDWEFAHFGDAAEDLSYCRPFVEPLIPWPHFLQRYYDYGGAEFSIQAERFFAVWRDFRNACAGVGAVGTLRISDKADIKSAASGIVFGPLFEIKALRSIIDASSHRDQS